MSGMWRIACVCSVLAAACGSGSTEVGGDGGRDARLDGAGEGGWLDGTTDSPFSLNDAGRVVCGDHACACDNGLDDDGDGTADGFDSECTGPYDDREDSFATGIPGDNIDEDCQDCFFDGNSGSGDDGCRYATSCRVDGTPTSGHGSCATCDVTEECLDYCMPRTPNGCDCFGCCEVFTGSETSVFVTIGGTCTLEDLDDEDLCAPCVQSDECDNPCGECELCLGRGPEDLPDDCFDVPDGGTDGGVDGGVDGGTPDAGPGYTCPTGVEKCTPEVPCATAGTYCYQGCCQDILI